MQRPSHAKEDKRTRARAVALVNAALRRGQLQRPKRCEVPGCKSGRRLHAHHDDYSKPLEVRWLCIPHHEAVHGALNAAEFGRQRSAVLRQLGEMIETLGTQRAIAKKIGVSSSYINDVFRGRRHPGEKILRYFGVRRVTHYATEEE